jgi:hypothetical protein
VDERSILITHIQVLARELRQAKDNLRLPRDEVLRERMQDVLGGEIREHQQALKMVQDDVHKNRPLDMCWNTFGIVRKDCRDTLAECLTLTQGALARDAGLDQALCKVADFLLDGLDHLGPEYMKWGRFTILAEEEFFGSMAAVIRLRYPDLSIWNLPVVAHEFGHFVAWRLEEPDEGKFKDYVQQFQDVLPPVSQTQNVDGHTRRAQEDRRRLFLHEYYADSFATYALGPAYAYTCLLLRFDPKAAYTDGQEHPSYQKRAHAILQTLEEMNKVEGSEGRYTGIIKNFRLCWEKSVEEARPPEQPATDRDLYRLEKLVETLHHRLGTKIYRVRYCGWSQAARISGRLADQQQAHFPQPGDKLRDVLNGAWRYRTNPPDGKRQDDEKLGSSAKSLCEKIVSQGDYKTAV